MTLEGGILVRRLYKSSINSVIDGVCGGMGEYFRVDPVLIRIIWVFATIFSMGTGIIAYIIAMLIIPSSPDKPNTSDQSL